VNVSHEPLNIQSYCGGLVAQVLDPSGDASPTESDGANAVDDGTTPWPPHAARAIAAAPATTIVRIFDEPIEIFSLPHSRKY
jgi:hypothetical protein